MAGQACRVVLGQGRQPCTARTPPFWLTRRPPALRANTSCSPKQTHPGRYAPGDPVEAWLHGVLCLDASAHLPRPPPKLPHPGECDLFYVERDTLFSFHT